MLLQPRRAGSANRRPALGARDGFGDGLRADVRQIDHDADPIHLGHDFAAVARQAAVRARSSRCRPGSACCSKAAPRRTPTSVNRLRYSPGCPRTRAPFWKPRMMPVLLVALGVQDVVGGAHQREQVSPFSRICASFRRCCRWSCSKSSHTETVQLAAVSPPFCMSSNTARLELGDDQAVDDDAVV